MFEKQETVSKIDPEIVRPQNMAKTDSLKKFDVQLAAFLTTLDSGINIGVRLLIFGLFSRGYVPY